MAIIVVLESFNSNFVKGEFFFLLNITQYFFFRSEIYSFRICLFFCMMKLIHLFLLWTRYSVLHGVNERTYPCPGWLILRTMHSAGHFMCICQGMVAAMDEREYPWGVG